MAVICPMCNAAQDERSEIVECVDCLQLGVRGCCISSQTGACDLCISEAAVLLSDIDDAGILGDGEEEVEDEGAE